MLLRVCKLFVRLRRGVDTSSVTLFHQITRCIMAFHGAIENGVERHGPCDDRVRLIDSRNNAFFRGSRERMLLSRDPRENPRNNRAFFRGSRNNELPNGSWIEPASQIEVCLSHVLVRVSSVSGPSCLCPALPCFLHQEEKASAEQGV